MSEAQYVDYYAHLSFVRSRGTLIPWILTLRSTDPPHEMRRFGYNREHLLFTDADNKYNLTHTDDYMPDFNLDHELDVGYEPEGFRTRFLEEFRQLTEQMWSVRVGAVDDPTYRWLSETLPAGEVVFPEERMYVGDAKTFAAAVSLNIQEKTKQMEETRQQIKDKYNWH